MVQIHEFLLDFQLFKKTKTPSGTIVPKGLKHFFSLKRCVFSVKHCVKKTLKIRLNLRLLKGSALSAFQYSSVYGC